MDKFLNYFENQHFVKWALSPTPELNSFWDTYLNDHPDEKKEIEYARILLSQLKQKEENEECDEIASIYARITQQIDRNKTKKSLLREFIFPLLKYAAVAIIFLSIGVLLVNQRNNSQVLAQYQAMKIENNETEARLILSDGGKILLPENESMVEYDQKGKIIINHKDTIRQKSKSLQNEMNQLIIPYGKNSSIRLPDGTCVFLNAGSILIYPTQFSKKSREVFLTGEGYFEIEHNPKIPFVVKTNDISVIAMGTSFNISTYPTDKSVETVLVEGSVIVKENNTNIFRKDVEMKPGELAGYDRETLETSLHVVDVNSIVAWHKGYLQFESTELSRIVLKLERYYNIKIYLDNPTFGIRRITGKLMLREEKERVLEVLASTASMTLYKINETMYNLK
jgi:transmembrane sensor